MTISNLASTMLIITSMFGACSDNMPWKGGAEKDKVAETASTPSQQTSTPQKECADKAYDATTKQIEGTWQCQSTTLEISRESGNVVVKISNKGTEGLHSWKYRCHAESSSKLTCKGNGTKTTTCNELKAGKNEYEEVTKVEYSDGNATFKFLNNGTLEWIDAKESLGDGMAFCKTE